MWVGLLPVASTPLWQLAQLPVTPACEIPTALMLAVAAVAAVAVVPVVAPAAGAAGAATTVPITALVCVAAAATVLRALLPFQLLGLWQPLQSWPTWWPLGRVVR